MASTSIEMPRISDSRMNSCRLFEHILPARVRKSIACHHSSCVIFASRTAAWTWLTTNDSISRNLGLSASFMRSITSCVSSGKIPAPEPSFAALIDVIPALPSRGPASVIGVVQEFPNRIPLDRPWIPVRRCDRRLGGSIQIGIGHTDLAKRPRTSMGYGKIEQGLRSMVGTERASHAADGDRRVSSVIGDRMRQDHGVRLGVRKAESTAQHVTQLVMKRHPYRSETGSADPGSEQSVGASVAVGRVQNNPRQRTTEGCDALLRKARRYGVGVLCIERLHGVGDRV